MSHSDARNLVQTLTQLGGNFFYAALTQFSVYQTNVNAGVVFALCIGGIHTRQGVFHFWKLTHYLFNLLGLQSSAFERSPYGCLKGECGF